jgi:aminoglycoside 3-N-acetyltransferase
MQADIAEFFALSQWSSYDKINALSRLIAVKMKQAGLHDVRLIGAPADGKTAYGGWVMPKAYDVEAARLTLLLNDGSTQILADYQSNPTSLMLYSTGTPHEGVTAELVVADNIEQCRPPILAGRLVLTSCNGVQFSQAAMHAGAVGIVCDGRFGRRFIKEGAYLDETNEWHNYTIPPWDDEGKGFGFSVCPAEGRQLRTRLEDGEKVRLHAVERTRHYDGVIPVVSGHLPGIEAEEIVLTGHYDEFGADDNCSQIAVGLEVLRAIRTLVENGGIPPLSRGIRLLFPMEARGFNALVQDPEETKNIRLGLNIDTVGTDQNTATTLCSLVDSFTALPSFAEELLAELLQRTAQENPLFRWRRVGADVIDNVFGEPLLGAPTPCLYHYSATHHLPLDTPDRIHAPMLLAMARITATYAGFVANAGLNEALWLNELVADHAMQRLQQTATGALRNTGDSGHFDSLLQKVEALQEIYNRRLTSARWLVPQRFVFPSLQNVAVQSDAFIGDRRLVPREIYDERFRDLQNRIGHAYREAKARITERAQSFGQSQVSSCTEPLPSSRCVPVKAFRGFLAFEDLSQHQRELVAEQLGIDCVWGAPLWLQEALMLANGKRTVSEIVTWLTRHGLHTPEVRLLEKVFEFLHEQGKVKLRPYLTQDDVETALQQAGLKPGDAVLGHFSLSRFGYIEGGAEGLIDTLLDLLGPDGTLIMPTFSFSWLGHLAFNAARTPSRVGVVSDHFWRRSGVQRSPHPTHSFAASGKLASLLLQGHDYTQAPLGEHSPINRLANADGKILMFAPLKSNTSMHVGEYLAGVPFVDFVCSIMENGARREIVVPRCPWHVQFEPAYEKLYARKLIQDVPLGESVIHTMRCADAIAAQAEVARETPEALLRPGCDCLYCQNLKVFCEARRQMHI